jgi:hypothetical protein
MAKLKKYKDFINENTETAPAPVKTPTRIKPNRPSPIKKPGIGVQPAPAKAETEEVIALFNKLASELDKKEVDSNYEKH